jgi:protocatechuate 3,4-dioxygenase beta subunit
MKRDVMSNFTSFVLVAIIYGLLIFSSFNQVIGSSTTPSPPTTQLSGLQPTFLQPELSATQRGASTNQTCTLTPSLIEVEGTPQQIEGPYFVDDVPNRSDIRSNTSKGSVQEGIPLRLVLNVYGVDDSDGDGTGSCTPLKDAKVDIWHANSQGVYSGVQDAGTIENDFLRGYQMTDDNGTVQFTTIYPGWYEGRAIHIHFKVRTFEGSNETLEWTSQFYLDDSVNELVHTKPPYSNHGPVDLTNEEDFIYTGPSNDGLLNNNTGKHLMLNLKDEGQGYIGTFNIGVNATQLRM